MRLRGPARLEDLELRWAGPRSAASVLLNAQHATRLTRLCILLDVEADAASLRALRAAGSPLRELCLQGWAPGRHAHSYALGLGFWLQSPIHAQLCVT